MHYQKAALITIILYILMLKESALVKFSHKISKATIFIPFQEENELGLAHPEFLPVVLFICTND